ncbi:hypothetical protein SERLA73DRAFT_141320 [Serpula lacrymans var. lacrymans S7.3]|uniref:Uncharacterized protein n=2 Tax=Serpula lacrymans var. lacrymans TaxID=341189 RepID=F8Q685_SERL3|nr:hypothetical protein SERLA73DRAFT_141320 [Serpula lacrymans var. lacrymans S7.3]
MVLEAVSDHDNKVAAKITTQDCLTAYIVNVLNRCLGSSIHMITNAASYRHSDAPFVHPDVAGNLIYIVRSEVMPPYSKGVGTIATVIRKSIIEWRQAVFISNWMSAASYLMHAAALEGKQHFFLPQPDVLAVNSNLS